MPPPVEVATRTVRDERLVCKICMESDIDCVFLDCGHVVSCINCAIQMDRCPICRDIIKSARRIYF